MIGTNFWPWLCSSRLWPLLGLAIQATKHWPCSFLQQLSKILPHKTINHSCKLLMSWNDMWQQKSISEVRSLPLPKSFGRALKRNSFHPHPSPWRSCTFCSLVNITAINVWIKNVSHYYWWLCRKLPKSTINISYTATCFSTEYFPALAGLNINHNHHHDSYANFNIKALP